MIATITSASVTCCGCKRYDLKILTTPVMNRDKIVDLFQPEMQGTQSMLVCMG